MWLEDTLKNREDLRLAFKDVEMGDYFMMDRIQFVPGLTDFMLNNGLKLDIMTTIKGMEGFSFEDSFAMATIADFEGLRVPFLHLNQLIANKKAVNRPKDRIDVIELEKILHIRNDEEQG